MKHFRFLSVVAIVGLMAFSSCTAMREVPDEDERYERTATPNRIYVDDPYYGTVVLERDPFTGRYYQVNSYGAYGSYGAYNRWGNDPYYGNRYRDNRYYRDRRQQQVQPVRPAPTQEQKEAYEKQRQEARKRILGN